MEPDNQLTQMHQNDPFGVPSVGLSFAPLRPCVFALKAASGRCPKETQRPKDAETQRNLWMEPDNQLTQMQQSDPLGVPSVGLSSAPLRPCVFALKAASWRCPKETQRPKDAETQRNLWMEPDNQLTQMQQSDPLGVPSVGLSSAPLRPCVFALKAASWRCPKETQRPKDAETQRNLWMEPDNQLTQMQQNDALGVLSFGFLSFAPLRPGVFALKPRRGVKS